jgi:acetyl esterase
VGTPGRKIQPRRRGYPMLDPQAKALIDLLQAKRVPPLESLPATEARRVYRERRFYSQPDPPPVGALQNLEIAGPGGPLPLREYRPAGAVAGVVLPALVFFHGGGFTIGDLDTHDVLCRQLCNASGCAVYSVDYRMGPEHRFPAAVDDALAATRWIAAHASELSIDAERIALGGDSAGANLAAVAALALRDADDGCQVAFQLLIYPTTDMRGATESHRVNGRGYLLTRDTIDYFQRNYIDDPAHYADWRASPLLAQDHSRLPPALVLTAGFDPLRDDGLLYANKLSAAGTPAQYVCFERQIHGVITMTRILDEATTAVNLCADVLRRAVASPATPPAGRARAGSAPSGSTATARRPGTCPRPVRPA